MIHSHLKPFATSLDERNYRVRFRDELEFDSNQSFHDNDGLDPAWIQRVWSMVFKAKLSAAAITVTPGQMVLDVCCGQGFLGEYLGEKGAHVTFTDLSRYQLASLRVRFEASGKSVQACEADVSSFPFRADSFDLVVGNSFLHHLPDVQMALREIYRVLKPGGRLVFFHEPSISANWWETFPISLIKDTTYNSGFTDLWQFRKSDLGEMLERSGFADTRIRGSGVLGALICNWYLILAGKLRLTNRFVLGPALILRALLSRLELALSPGSGGDIFPSLFISASKRAVSPSSTGGSS